MAKKTTPTTPALPPATDEVTVKVKRTRAVDPVILAAKEQLAAAKVQAKDNLVKAKIAKLQARAAKLNSMLDKIDDEIAKLNGVGA